MQADGYISPTHHACAAVAATEVHGGPVSDAVQCIRVDSVSPSGATVTIAHATQEAETPFAAVAADTESTEKIVPASASVGPGQTVRNPNHHASATHAFAGITNRTPVLQPADTDLKPS